MKKLFFLALLLNYIIAEGQTIDEAFITGQWKATKAVALNEKDKNKPDVKALVNGFQKATYNFKSDHSFSFSSNGSSQMMKQLITLFNDDNKWIFDKKKKQIKVGHKSEGYSTIAFKVRLEKKKVIFLMEDAGIEMVMKKQ